MEKKWLKKIINLLRSLRFKIFISVSLLIMIPTIIVSIVLVNLSVDSYSDKKIEQFKINNSMLKNSIVSKGYLEKNNQSKVIETQIAQLAGEHNCRVQIINSQYVIVEDTDNSAVGKTSVAENVIKAMEGKSIFINSKKGKYTETRGEERQTYGDVMLNLSKTFKEKFSLDAHIGASIKDNRFDELSVYGPIAGAPNIFNVVNLDKSQKKTPKTGWHEQTQSFFYSLELGWKSQLFVTTTGRNDWASQLANSTQKSFF